jgi:excisionase family DNA binding protein
MPDALQQVADLITANTIFCTKEVLTSDEAAKYLGVSKSCLYKWTMTRQIPHYKSPTGKMCFFNRKEIEAWMQSQRVATDEELEAQAEAFKKEKGGRK